MKIILISIGVVCVVWCLIWWKRHPLRFSLLEVLRLVVDVLPLQNPIFRKYPNPTVVGDYFGFKISLEGSPKKGAPTKEKGFQFLATIELPKVLKGRVFLQSELRKASFKPIAELKLVHTGDATFDQHFMVLASDEILGGNIFQPYLRRKILFLSERNWQLDVHAKQAHWDIWQSHFNAQTLADCLKTIVECLNVILIKVG